VFEIYEGFMGSGLRVYEGAAVAPRERL